MLDFFFRAEAVNFLSLEDRLLTFECRRRYKPGRSINVKVAIPDPGAPSGSTQLKLPVCVSTLRPVEGAKNRYICSGEVPVGPDVLIQVKGMLDHPEKEAPKGLGTRRRTRHRSTLRLVSKELPGFRALSVDFNPLGLQIQAEGAAEVGSVLTLDIELERSSLPRVLCRAQVRWCRQLERKRFLLGLEFVEMPVELTRELEEFERVLLASQKMNVMHRQLMGGEEFIPMDINVPAPETAGGSTHNEAVKLFGPEDTSGSD